MGIPRQRNCLMMENFEGLVQRDRDFLTAEESAFTDCHSKSLLAIRDSFAAELFTARLLLALGGR
jgi:hypothetical protein